jgi:acyl-CoA hydrolase
MNQVSPLRSRDITMTVLMTPDMVNFSGNIHGGAMLKLLDQVAYACAVRYSGRYAVTLAVEKVLFKEPVYVGELATFLARINYVGKTSMEVGIKVVTENPRDGRCRHVMSCFIYMVSVDESRTPVKIEPFTPETDDDKRRWTAALGRKATLSA